MQTSSCHGLRKLAAGVGISRTSLLLCASRTAAYYWSKLGTAHCSPAVLEAPIASLLYPQSTDVGSLVECLVVVSSH